ncbi:MAG: SDR family NAD(P)-dependent oxidoreductase [Steroidobacteraceae bacterium]
MNEVAVITGTTHGIGRVTSRGLAIAGRTVVMLCRDVQAGNVVRDEITEQVPGATVHVVHCDLASLVSVRNSADVVRRTFGPIGLLINNAGMVSSRHRMSEDGFELTFATNHLGPFLLTALLSDRLNETARVINVASRAHYRGRIDFRRITDPRARYSGVAAYAQSKLANVLHTFALARRLSGTRVCANCLHPGVVATNLLPRWLRVVKPLISRVIFNSERGARTSVGGDRARSNEPLNPLRFFVARVVHGCDWAARACGGGHSPPGRPPFALLRPDRPRGGST